MLVWPYAIDEDAASELKTAVDLTVCVKIVEVLVEKPEAPLYTAVMEWDPAASVEVVSVATPEPLSVTALPRAVDPSLNVTEPVGVWPPAFAVTVAVNVTGVPESEGLEDDDTVVVVATTVTTRVAAELVKDLVPLQRFPLPLALSVTVKE
jgi:hypothetical protein